MTARVHLHLHVSNLSHSRDFYEKLFGLPPVKDYPDYVKFLPDFAPVNLALSSGETHPATSGAVGHMGVQMDSTAEVVRHLNRAIAAGLLVRTEFASDCCHANQDKFWVKDPDGVQWEIYHLNHDIEPPKVQDGVPVLQGGVHEHGGVNAQGVALPLVTAQAVGCCAPGVACGA